MRTNVGYLALRCAASVAILCGSVALIPDMALTAAAAPPAVWPGKALRLPAIPRVIAERESLKRELRESLLRKYRLNDEDVEIDDDHSGLGISVLLLADDLTPENQRGRVFKDHNERARSVLMAFLEENPRLFLEKQPGVEIVEQKIFTRQGATEVTYMALVAGVPLNHAWASGAVRENGSFVSMGSVYPVIARETIENITAAAAKSALTEKDVLAIVEADRRRTTPDAAIAMAQPKKLAFPTPPYVRWELGVLFKGEETIQQGWSYEVDGVTGSILRRTPPYSKRDELAPLLPPLPPPPTAQ